jgi:pSer/pThr/pTyr-binding forkhead associated (FHA) protein
MRDGRTQKQANQGHGPSAEEVLSKHRLVLVVTAGNSPGTEIELTSPRMIFGRGPGVDVQVADKSMSRQHFSVEIVGGGARACDLGSTNGLTVNGKRADCADLSHGDRLRAGEHEFRFLIEEVEREPRTYVVSD